MEGLSEKTTEPPAGLVSSKLTWIMVQSTLIQDPEPCQSFEKKACLILQICNTEQQKKKKKVPLYSCLIPWDGASPLPACVSFFFFSAKGKGFLGFGRGGWF